VKKGLFTSYVAGITDKVHGERYSTIFSYFLPEYISALLLYSLPFFLDAAFISHLRSTSTYATLGATNNLIHFIIKLAEGFSVGTVILCGQFNGKDEYKKVGSVLRDAFWVTFIVGLSIASFFYFGAPWIYAWMNVPEKIITRGVPFLRLRAIAVFLTFVYMAFVGFLRGIKNVKVPMYTFVLGAVLFVFFDYLLIFGKFGFPAMGLQGSAVASVIQYTAMTGAIIFAIFFDSNNRKYGINLFSGFKQLSYIKELFFLSWPVVLDKATMAGAYVWLAKMIGPMGTASVAGFCVVKDMERFAFLPAIACAQVITFLVSNDFGAQKWHAIKSNIKKITFLASLMVFTTLLLFSLWPQKIIYLFDKKDGFTALASRVFPFLSILVFFDLVQLILSGALRGAGNVRIVMLVRLTIFLGYFIPVSYFFAHMNIQDQAIKLLLIYGSFYFGNAFMSLVYIHRLRGEKWKRPTIKENI